MRSVTNLFDPSRPVMNANDWLARLRGPRFDSAALSLKDLLNIPLFKKLAIESGKVLVPMHRLLHPLDDLSAGYESGAGDGGRRHGRRARRRSMT